MINHQVVNEDSQDRNFDFYHLQDANDEEIEKFSQRFDLPEDFFTSGLDKDEIARFETLTNEQDETYFLAVVNYPFYDKDADFRDKYHVYPAAVVLKRGTVIMTSIHNIPEILDTRGEEHEFEYHDELDIVLDLLWYSSRAYVENLKQLKKDSHELEQTVIHSDGNTDIFKEMMTHNKALVYFNSRITQNKTILENIEKTFDDLEADNEDYAKLRDISVEYEQARVMAEEMEDQHKKLSEILSSVVSNNMNQIMKFLTVWSLILTIPTIISGIWGMNTAVPGEGSLPAFHILNIVSLIIMIVLIIYFKKKDWL